MTSFGRIGGLAVEWGDGPDASRVPLRTPHSLGNAASGPVAVRVLDGEQEQQRDEQREDAERFREGEAEEQVAALAVKGAEQILRKEVDAGVHADLLARLKTEL